MKKLTRLYDEDLRIVVADWCKARLDQVTSVYTDEVDPDTGDVTPVFYIEVEEDA